MTYALLLWMATAQAPSSATAQREGLTVIVNVSDDRELKAALEAAKSRMSKLEEQADSPEHAIATLLAADKADMTTFTRFSSRSVEPDRGPRADLDVYLPWEGKTVAVVIELTNPRSAQAWEPIEARLSIEPPPDRRWGQPVRWGPPEPATAVRSSPRKLAPGQKGRIVVVFDNSTLALGTDDAPLLLEILRDQRTEFSMLLRPGDVQRPPEPNEPEDSPLTDSKERLCHL